MLLLALDTSTSAITVALHDGDRVLAQATTLDARAHGERLAPGIQQVLAQAGATPTELTHVVCGLGPGPFTGLRVGIVTARTLGLVCGVPVRGFGTLDAIALGWFAGDARPAGEVAVVTDARRKELYWASYDASGQRIGGPAVSAPGEVPALPTGGPGVLVYPEVFAGRVPTGAPVGLDAGLVAARIAQLPDVGLEPAYLRKPDAEAPRTRKSALAGGRLRLPKPQEAR